MRFYGFISPIFPRWLLGCVPTATHAMAAPLVGPAVKWSCGTGSSTGKKAAIIEPWLCACACVTQHAKKLYFFLHKHFAHMKQ